MEMCVKYLLFAYFLFFSLIFKHDFIKCVDFTRIAASNKASDDVTNYATHKIFNTDLSYSCAHLVDEIDEKSNCNGGL